MMRFLQRIAINPDQEVLPFVEKGFIFAAVRRVRNDVRFENLNNFLNVRQTGEAYTRLFHPGGTEVRAAVGKQIHIMRSK